MNEDKVRADFERLIESDAQSAGLEASLKVADDGSYLDPSIQSAWFGYRAAYAQARRDLRDKLSAFADNEYCRGIDQSRRTECLGWEAKVKNGKFGGKEFEAHAKANKHFGGHFAIYEAVNLLIKDKP